MIDYPTLEKALKKNEFTPYLFETIFDAIDYLLKTLNPAESIGMGGSMTIQDSGLYEKLIEAGYQVHWHWNAPIEQWYEIREEARHAVIYICTANSVSMDGKLVFMDGASNRVSAMLYGPRDVYLLVGKNKICTDLSSARKRIFDVVAPKISKLKNYKTPCKETGKCYDCATTDRCCRVEVILHKKPRDVNMHVFLIDEELGY
jgi:hypothetical protein